MFAPALAALGLSLPAAATTYSTDFTDLWFNPGEEGWGINLIQQNEVIFATLFVYGADSSARWYVASDLSPAGAGNTATFTGTLYQTTGPFFAGPWSSSGRQPPQPVGSMTITFNSSNSGTLTYNVGTAPVTKTITRQTWRNDQLGGRYLGGMTATCSAQQGTGQSLIFGAMGVTHNGGAWSAVVDVNSLNPNSANRCTFTGQYTQSGSQGRVGGTFSCVFAGTAQNQGTFAITEMKANRNGFTGAFTGQDQFCRYEGFFGGTRDVL